MSRRSQRNPDAAGSPATRVVDAASGRKTVPCVVSGEPIVRSRTEAKHSDSAVTLQMRALQNTTVWSAALEEQAANGKRSKDNAAAVIHDVGQLVRSTRPGEANCYEKCRQTLAAGHKSSGQKGPAKSYSRNEWMKDILARASAAAKLAEVGAGAAVAAKVDDMDTRLSKVGESCLPFIC